MEQKIAPPEQKPNMRTMAVPGVVDLTHAANRLDGVILKGFAYPEPGGTWTEGREAQISFAFAPVSNQALMLRLEIAALLDGKLPKQTVTLSIDGIFAGTWIFAEKGFHVRPVSLPLSRKVGGDPIVLGFTIPDAQSPLALGIGPDPRQLGIMIRRIFVSAMPDPGSYADPNLAALFQLGRRVGAESRRTYDEKIGTGFWARYITGPRVLDIGCKGNDATGAPPAGGGGLPVCEGAIGVDLDYPGYDGLNLPFPTESQDTVYCSHALEHISDCIKVIQEWHRVTKNGGHIIVMVPHAHLYERRMRPPSRWNGAHVRMYTASSLLAEFEAALAPNSCRVRHLLEDDRDYCYGDSPDLHPSGGYEIELVVQKIIPPKWLVEV